LDRPNILNALNERLHASDDAQVAARAAIALKIVKLENKLIERLLMAIEARATRAGSEAASALRKLIDKTRAQLAKAAEKQKAAR
jgi:hypothetical protein